jgi:UDP-N-acetylglucosamine 2-epimerase (non-hydrolysing)
LGNQLKIITVVGARPNFIKVAPLIKEIQKYNNNSMIKIDYLLLHTGQHYDDRMSEIFFKELKIPKVDIDLGIGSGSHAEQVGKTMISFEKVLGKDPPDWVVVVGDVNATLACTITAKKMNIKVCHIEAGLRSGDMRMPEEINRLVTDRLSDLLLTPDELSSENLRKEGVPNRNIKFVGNIMIDTLYNHKVEAKDLDINKIILKNIIDSQIWNGKISYHDKSFGLMTIHRPSNVDEKDIFEPIIRFILDDATKLLPLIWPIHPRAKKQLIEFGLWNDVLRNKQLILLNPIGYHAMLKLNMESKIMLTDSGGLQEECTVLGTPCLTLRWNTERPITLQENGGTCKLVGNSEKIIGKEFYLLLNDSFQPSIPKLWDGNTAKRCLDEILGYDKENNKRL